MRKINIYLHLLMFIGVGVTLLHFFSTPVKAESYYGRYVYQEVLDDVYEIARYTNNTSTGAQTIKWQYKTHIEVTITTNSDYAYGTTTVYGTTISYSGRNTVVTVQGREGQITTSTNSTSGPDIPLISGSGTFTPSIIDTSTIAELEYRTKSIHFKGYTKDFNTITLPTGAVTLSPDNYLIFENINWVEDEGMVLYNITLPVGGNLKDINDFKFYLRYKDDPYDMTEIPVYAVFDTLSRSYFNLYFTIQNAYRYGSGFDLVIQPLKQYRYYPSNFNNKLNYILPTDIYYNELTFYINTYEYYHRNTEEVTDVNNSNSSFQSSSDQMIQLEDQLQGDFNSAIGNITVPSNPFGNMGVMFGNSSRFLVHMFDQMTISNGSPFGTVITFSLILGLALLMIGKKGSK